MENKHFEIAVKHGHHAFTFCCTTMAEAYDAIVDIMTDLPEVFRDDLDRVMETLVAMKNGEMLGTDCYKYSIHVRDGEV